jgi:hypothetical protein
MFSPVRLARRCRSLLASARCFWGGDRLASVRSAQPSLEGLENRVVPTISASLNANGLLTLTNTTASEAVTLTFNGSTDTVQTTTNNIGGPNGNGTKAVVFSDAQVKGINLVAGDLNGLNFNLVNTNTAVALRTFQVTTPDGFSPTLDFSALNNPNLFYIFNFAGGTNNFTPAPVGVNLFQFNDATTAGTTTITTAANEKIGLDFSALTAAKSGGVTLDLTNAQGQLGSYKNEQINTQAGGGANITAVRGSQQADNITGNNNGDYLVGNGGNDSLVGGAGSDQINFIHDFSRKVTDLTTFNAANDGKFALYGFGIGTGKFNVDSAAANVEANAPATLFVNSGNGNDSVFGANGVTVKVFLGSGNCNFSEQPNEGFSYIDGGTGTDSLFGDTGDTLIGGSGGNNVISCGFNASLPASTTTFIFLRGQGNSATGTIGPCQITGSAGGRDTVQSGPGNDTIFAGGGSNDILIGQSANLSFSDTIFGQTGSNNRLQGGNGHDLIAAGSGTGDFLVGNSGDTVFGVFGVDFFDPSLDNATKINGTGPLT